MKALVVLTPDHCVNCRERWGGDLLRNGLCPDCYVGRKYCEMQGTLSDEQMQLDRARGKQWKDI